MNNNDVVTETVKTETPVEQPTEKVEKTFTRDELNKMIATEKKKTEASVRAELEKEIETKKNEADRLAKMNEDEKTKYALDKAENERQEAISKLNAYELKETALEIATEKGMDLTLVSILDYSRETAESVKDKMSKMDTVFKKAVENAVNDKLKEKSPKQVVGGQSTSQSYLDKKYANNPFYKK